MQLTNVNITNFRGIQHISLEKFGLVNVFLGTNNVGKSTILEAIFMLTGMSNPLMPTWINNLRLSSPNNLPHLKYLFHKVDFNNHPVVEGVVSNKLRNVELIPQFTIAQPNAKGVTSISSTDSASLSGLELKFTNGNQHYSSQVVIENGNPNIKPDKSYIEPLKAIFIPSGLKETTALNSFSELVRRQLKDSVIKTLRQFDSKIKSVEVLNDGIYFQIEGLSELLPISMAGDGIRRFFSITTFVADPTTDVVLIDEIENGLHYTAYKKLWKSLILTALSNNVQLFVSTHSKETLRCLATIYDELQEKLQADDIRIYTIDKEINNIQYAYALSAEGLQGAIENNIEIRQ